MEAVDVDGLRVAYQRVGQGPPVVLVHGYVGDGPTSWQPQLEALGDELTLVAWDAPGAGVAMRPALWVFAAGRLGPGHQPRIGLCCRPCSTS